ncbi:MAG: Cytochrome c biogenesis protein Ccs1 [Deltaproteobacteria bacterium ADurb.BinA179]|jgi:cytochrome c biogenesis protein ResB|nr:cytochrome c biogenesis protein ResB [Deltaproteobacteria bacterium]MDI9542387.1 cytochrome c biogenesis protein ResB [Pseudomonadota bacterium]OPZ26828.1 MAG: Cytochrome c biogenesis protein Ccs1 [Deltaproteobacteria bacterium ADurb.BinA179]HRR19766.1 cytochrome c biogenesis protein ResB [Desulfomonilia bacterium]HNR51711.1 cytochrome c biogenesis protein ResB [Deltaproteobacteria bacterium]
MKVNGEGLLKFLSSLKLTVGLLLIISAICLIGTLFPQMSGGSRIAALLGPYDIFHSIWFMAAGFLLCANLIMCMSRRLKLKRRSILMLLLHAGILLVIAGYALGALGLDGIMEIPEGETVSGVRLRDGSSAELGFSVKCERFSVDYYENGMPREYVSDLAFLKDGGVAGRAQVRVNHPADMGGFSFYQQSFRLNLSALLSVSDGQSKTAVRVSEGDIIPLSAAGDRARVVKIWHDLMHAGPAVKLMIEGVQGERLLWVFQNIEELKNSSPDLFEKMPGFDPSSVKPYTFACEGIHHTFITGIGVRRDPGMPLAGAGGAIFLVSLLLVYLIPRSGSSSAPQTSQAVTPRTAPKKGTARSVRVKAKAKRAAP